MIEVLALGAGATIQDRGRPGYAALGVPRSGAFDPAAAELANRLVGNDRAAACLEIVLGGLVVRLEGPATVALVGAPCPLSASPPVAGLAWAAPVSLRAGTVLRMGAPVSGLRAWLAVRGGFDVPLTLGSRSTDTLGRLGPAPLRVGDRIRVGRDTIGPVPGVDHAPSSTAAAPVRVYPGPRADWVTPESLARLWAVEWRIRPDSDRVGIRLDGPPLHWRGTAQLPSEAVLPGAIQIPPDGRPIVFGPDAPTTGGYPVVGVVATDRAAGRAGARAEGDAGAGDGLAALAQLRPGDPVRLRPAALPR